MADPYAGCGADGCDHRPVASGRAWCSTCSEWCYPRPEMRCARGQLDQAQTLANDFEAISVGQHNELMRLRAKLLTVRELHTPTPTTWSPFGAWCPTCSTTAPCRTLQALDSDHQED